MILGIMGGMGPAATADLFSKIIRLSPARRDQEHIHVLIDSNAQIPDRTAYLLGKGEDPTPELVRTAWRLESMGAEYLAIACNTAHFFYDRIRPFVRVPVLHMVRETAVHLKRRYSTGARFLLLATEGTYAAGVYRDVFSEEGLDLLEPEDDDRAIVMDWIHREKAGEDSVSRAAVDAFLGRYQPKGDDLPVILGCTELPLLAERLYSDERGRFTDPSMILAKSCVDFAYGVRRE